MWKRRVTRLWKRTETSTLLLLLLLLLLLVSDAVEQCRRAMASFHTALLYTGLLHLYLLVAAAQFGEQDGHMAFWALIARHYGCN
jgi:hypothetical protein